MHDTPHKILVAGGRGFIGRFVMGALPQSPADVDNRRYLTLGRSAANDIVADLTAAAPDLSADAPFDLVVHLVGTCDSADPDLCRRLNVDATANLLRALEVAPPRRIAYVSTVAVYGRTEGSDLGEATIAEPATAVAATKLEAEAMLGQWCRDRGVQLLVLRCPDVVGTGMHGPMRRLVNTVYRGMYNHVADETARLSVVHATDVARALLDTAIPSGVYNLTDGVDPTRRELVDALAARMNDKHVMTISAKRARRLAAIGRWLPLTTFTPASLAERYRTLTFSNAKFLAAASWAPRSVAEYLRTHNYTADDV